MHARCAKVRGITNTSSLENLKARALEDPLVVVLQARPVAEALLVEVQALVGKFLMLNFRLCHKSVRNWH
jgi:hypothetical protein